MPILTLDEPFSGNIDKLMRDIERQTCQQDRKNEEQNKLDEWENAHFKKVAGCDMRVSSYSQENEELALISGEAQDASGQYIKLENTPKNEQFAQARNGMVFRKVQRNLMRQYEKEGMQI